MHPFKEGETYSNPEYDYDILVMSIDEEDPDVEVWLAICWIDPTTKGNYGADEIRVDSEDYDEWTKQELV